MLLEPFEEQLDLPAVFVQCGNGQRWQDKVVGQEDKRLATFRILETDAAQVLWIILRGIKAIERHSLVADDAGGLVHRMRVNASGVQVDLGACHEEAPGLMQTVQPSEVQIASIHDIKGACLDWQEIQNVDLVHLAVADVDKGWDGATQIQQGVQFDGSLGLAKRCPVEQAQTQIDGHGIQRIDRVLQVQPLDLGVAVELSSPTDQQCSHIRPDTPVARLVRIGQRRSAHAVSQAHCIKLVGIGAERHLDVPKALAPRQLRKRHYAKLFCARQTANAGVATVAIDNPAKARPWHELHDLRKKRFADVHERSPRGCPLGNYPKMKKLNSNRHQIKSASKPSQYWLSLINIPA